MSEIVRSVVSRLRGYVGERRFATRVPARLRFSLAIQGANGRLQFQFSGFTLNISANGLGLVFHSVRIDTYYLIRDGRPLSLTLELPPGPVRMVVTPVRHERLGDSKLEVAHLIGVTITTMSDADRQLYLAYLLPRLKHKTSSI